MVTITVIEGQKYRHGRTKKKKRECLEKTLNKIFIYKKVVQLGEVIGDKFPCSVAGVRISAGQPIPVLIEKWLSPSRRRVAIAWPEHKFNGRPLCTRCQRRTQIVRSGIHKDGKRVGNMVGRNAATCLGKIFASHFQCPTSGVRCIASTSSEHRSSVKYHNRKHSNPHQSDITADTSVASLTRWVRQRGQ